MTDTDEQTLNDITYLQRTEKELTAKLETDSNLNETEQSSILKKINKLSDMRISMYRNLGQINKLYTDASRNSNETINEQTQAILIVEKNLNETKKRLSKLKQDKLNQLRLVEINNYYSEKYEEHAHFMKLLLFTFLPALVVTILYKKGLFPSKLYVLVLVVIFGIGSYYLIKCYISMLSRDALNYNSYDWNFDVNVAPKDTTTEITGMNPWLAPSIGALNIGSCIGAQCCDSTQTYDSKLQKCILNKIITN